MQTKSSIAALLNRNPKAVFRALVVLFERQTADEQESESTKHLNGRGFNATDAKFGTDLAKQVLAHAADAFPKYQYPLSSKQYAAARDMLRKYEDQLARIANGEECVV